MLTLSIPTQSHFGSPTMSPTGSPTAPSSRPPMLQPALRPPTLMNPAAPRRSMMPQGCKRPKLSLQTSILPQPVSPALPLPCSADTPTSRNTLANSFRSPGPEKQTFERADLAQPQGSKENAQLPYGVESAKDGILKNTPLAKLIRSRKMEKRRNVQARIKFVEEPQLIPRPPQDFEPEVDEDDETAEPTSATSTSANDAAAATSSSTESGLKSNDSTQWRRLRTQRSANEGRELRRSSSSSTPIVSAPSSTPGGAPSSPAPSDSSASESSDYMPPQTPETPSPAQTRDWVWTLGNDFNNNRSHAANNASNSTNGSGNTDWAPYTPPDSSDNSRRSSAATAGEGGLNALPMPSRQQLGAAIKTPPVIGGRLPDTPVSATEGVGEPVTPRMVPLPETPASRGRGC